MNVHTLSPGMVFTDLLLNDSTPKLRKFPFGVLAAQPPEVAADLVPKILAVSGNGQKASARRQPRAQAEPRSPYPAPPLSRPAPTPRSAHPAPAPPLSRAWAAPRPKGEVLPSGIPYDLFLPFFRYAVGGVFL